MQICGNRQYSCTLKFKEQSILDRNPRQVCKEISCSLAFFCVILLPAVGWVFFLLDCYFEIKRIEGFMKSYLMYRFMDLLKMIQGKKLLPYTGSGMSTCIIHLEIESVRQKISLLHLCYGKGARRLLISLDTIWRHLPSLSMRLHQDWR